MVAPLVTPMQVVEKAKQLSVRTFMLANAVVGGAKV